MNSRSFYLIALLLTTALAFGSIKPIPITSATIEWKAYKIAYERWGTIKLKSGELLFEDDALTGGNFVVDMTSIQVTSLEGKKKASLEKHLRSDDFFDIDLECSTKLLVVPAMADTTTISLLPLSCSFLIIFAACKILFIEPTDVPPNFNTFFAILRFYYKIIKLKLSYLNYNKELNDYSK